MYPQKLQNHTIPIFRIEECRAYYHKDDYPLNMHTHNFYELNIVVEGTGAHYIEDNVFPTSAGDVFVLPPNYRHGYWSEDNLNIFHLILPHHVIEKHAADLNRFAGYKTLFEIEPYIRRNCEERAFLHLSDEQLARLRLDTDNLLSVLEQPESEENNVLFEIRSILIVCTLARLIETESRLKLSGSAFPDALFIIRAIEFMNNNYADKISINDLAVTANMSRSTFLRRFTAMCKISPNEYLTEIRVKKSCELLKNANLNITEIAQACGFFDCSHYIRVFGKLCGTTPLAYRKSLLPKR